MRFPAPDARLRPAILAHAISEIWWDECSASAPGASDCYRFGEETCGGGSANGWVAPIAVIYLGGNVKGDARTSIEKPEVDLDIRKLFQLIASAFRKSYDGLNFSFILLYEELARDIEVVAPLV